MSVEHAAAASPTTAAVKARPPVKAAAPTAAKSGSPANKPSSATKSSISKQDAEKAGNWGKGLAGLSLLFMLISWHAPWFADPTGGTTQVSLQAANQLSLLLFVKGFWCTVAGALLAAGAEGYLANAVAGVLGCIAVGCLGTAYDRLEGSWGGAYNVHPTAGFDLCLIATLMTLVATGLKLFATHGKQTT